MSGNNEHVVTVDGSVVKCKVGCVSLTVDGQTIDWQCLVLNSMLKQFKLIIGMDIIQHLGGVNISKAGHVAFKQCASKQTISAISVRVDSELDIHDVDFDAKFDDKKWTIKWKWVGPEPEFQNKLALYKIYDHAKLAYDTEVQSWVDEGILQPVPRDCYVETVVPMMAVVQQNNKHVSNHSGGSDTCDDKLRKWRRLENNILLLDLRNAYLQIRVDPGMWKHQTIR